jgi:PAS domain S-box-containing protein
MDQTVSKKNGGAEEGRSSREQELRLLVETIPALVWRAAPDGNIEYVNKRVLDYFGAPLSDIIGWGWAERVHSEDVAFKVRTWLDNLKTENTHDVVCRFRGADGRYRWFNVRGEPLRANNGTVLSWYGVMIDIDDQKRAEEASRESDYKLRQIIETVPSLLWSTDPDGEPTHLNQRLLDYSGMRFEEFLHGGWKAFVHPDDFPETARAFSHAIQTGTPYRAVNRLRRADGEFRWHHTCGEPLRDQHGRIIQWYGVSVDIDEGKRGFTAQLQATLNVLPTYTWYSAPSGALLFVNKRTGDYLGLPEDHPLRFGIEVGAQWDDWVPLLHPDDRDHARNYLAECLRKGQGGEHSYRVADARGAYRWFLTRFEPLRASDGTLLLWVGATLDIEELKTAEQDLQRSRFYLSEGQRVARIGSWAFNASGAFDHWSEELFQIYGLDPQKGAPTLEQYLATIHPLDRESMAEIIRRMHAERGGCDVKKRIVRPDGEIRYVRCVGIPVIEDDVLKGFLGTAMDITEQELLTQELRLSEAKFRDYAETASDWFWEIGPDYSFTLLTENAFGLGAPDRIGRMCWDSALDLETEPEKWRVVQDALNSRKPFRDFVYRGISGDGSPMYVKASGKPVFDGNGEFRGYRGTGSDVTATIRAQEEHERLRRLESDLAHMNRLSVMGELTGTLAHEITQPIAAARNNARAAMRFLDRGPPDLSEVKEALECIVADADRAGHIVDRVRDHIKKAPPRKDRFDLNKAIGEVIGLAQSAITANGVSVRTRLVEALDPVQGDRVQLQQVVLNLILNAVEAMSTAEAGARELLISTEQTGTGSVLVSVRDSGPGIALDHLDRVFEAFYTTKSSGVGMGLSICRSIINGHGGRLWADALASRGAVFQFTLPGANEELTKSRPPTHVTPEPHEDTESDVAHQPAYEGSKRPRRSERGRSQRRRDSR